LSACSLWRFRAKERSDVLRLEETREERAEGDRDERTEGGREDRSWPTRTKVRMSCVTVCTCVGGCFQGGPLKLRKTAAVRLVRFGHAPFQGQKASNL
jgi:hypothetical protein